MAITPFLPLATDAWIADTAHLGRAERGLYMDLLLLMWRTPECRVPNDLDWISRKLRCSETEIVALKSIIAEFCRTSGNWLDQKRLRQEWEFVSDKRKKQSERAKLRWEKEKDTCQGNAAPHVTGSAHHTTPHHIVPLDKSNGEAAEIDPTKVMFDAGIALLRAAGIAEPKARGLLGKWRRDHGDEGVMSALGKAKREGALDPVAFVEGCFRARRATAPSRYSAIEDTAPPL